jgi:hypothetical protein
MVIKKNGHLKIEMEENWFKWEREKQKLKPEAKFWKL